MSTFTRGLLWLACLVIAAGLLFVLRPPKRQVFIEDAISRPAAELRGDHWYWYGCEGLAPRSLRRIEYLIQHPLMRTTWGYYIYCSGTVIDVSLRSQISVAFDNARPTTREESAPYRGNHGEREATPDWWRPAWRVTLPQQTQLAPREFFVDGENHDIIYWIFEGHEGPLVLTQRSGEQLRLVYAERNLAPGSISRHREIVPWRAATSMAPPFPN